MIFRIIKIAGRNILKKFNVKLVKIDDSCRVILTDFAVKNQNVKFLQIGANDGVSHDCLYEIVLKYKWQGVVVEPLDEFFKKLQLNYSFYRLVTPVKYALHPKEKYMTIYKLNPLRYGDYDYWAGGIASFDREHLKRHNVSEEDIIEEQVSCVDLMTLIANNNIEDLDYLQIDTEGYDVEILKMIDFNIIMPKLIRFECSNLKKSELETAKKILSKYQLKREGGDMYAYLKQN